MKDTSLKTGDKQMPGPERIGQKQQRHDDGRWRNQRLERVADERAFIHRSRGMDKQSTIEKQGKKSVGLEADSPQNMEAKPKQRGATQQIHREDPQAGYDQVDHKTEQNGKVSPNPKDSRND